MTCESSNDRLFGGGDEDALFGEAGDDFLDGDGGTDGGDSGQGFNACFNLETDINRQAWELL